MIIDPHGEYGSAFGDKAIVFRAYNDADAGVAGTRQIKLPYWLMSSDEFRRLVVGKGEFEATSQANVVYKALTHARMYGRGLVTAANHANHANRKTDTIGHPDLPRCAEEALASMVAEFDRDWPAPFDLDEFRYHIEICQNNRRQANAWQPVTDSEFQQKFASILERVHFTRGHIRRI